MKLKESFDQVAAVILVQILQKIACKTVALVMRFLKNGGGYEGKQAPPSLP